MVKSAVQEMKANRRIQNGGTGLQEMVGEQ